MKNLIKLTNYGLVFLVSIGFLISCDSAEAENDTASQQEMEQAQMEQQAPAQAEAAVDILPVEETVSGETLRMIGDKVNMRSEPTLKGEILEQLSINEVFEIKGKTSEISTIQKLTDYWYEIEKDGQKGWVFGALTTETLNEKENADKASEMLEIWGNKVNVRTKPSLKGDIVMQLNDGQVAKIIKQTEDFETIGYDTDFWYQIEINGKRGWVFGWFTSRQLVYEGCSG